MKLIWTLALVALAMAALSPALSSAVPASVPLCTEASTLEMSTSDLGTDTPTSFNTDFDDFDRRCLRHCSVVLCANPQVCGVYTNSSGQRACGCH
jgi:hypothetical protein